MVGFAIVGHAVRMLIYNVWTTVRLTVFPFLLTQAVAFALAYTLSGPDLAMMSDGMPVGAMPSTGFYVSMLLILAVTWVMMSWLAVAWHRYALKNEDTGTILPPPNREFVMSYLGASLKVGFAVAVIALLVAIGLGMIFAALGSVLMQMLPPFIVILVASYMAIRLGLVLPAAAVGAKLSLRASWDATRGYSGAVAVAVVVTLLASLPTELSLGPVAVDVVLTLVFQWLALVLGLSILTTLYGVCVEGRSLD